MDKINNDIIKKQLLEQEKIVENKLHIQERKIEQKVEDRIISHEKYLDEKFKGVHIQLDSEFSVVNEKITNILSQVTKTNSRVTHNEEDIVALKIKDIEHINNCPVMPKLEEYKDKMSKDFADIAFFARHPRIGIAIISAFIIIFIGSSFAFLNGFRKDVKEIKEQVKIEISK